MPDIMALRARTIALLDRRRAVREALEAMAQVRLMVDPSVRAACDPEFGHEDDEHDKTDADRVLREVPPGGDVSLTSKAGLLCLCSDDDWGVNGAWSTARNLHHHLDAMAAATAERDGTGIEVGVEPSLDGLGPFEVSAIVAAYVALVETSTAELRDVATHMGYVRRTKSAMPRHLRERCLGMFGKADFPTGFAYVETDFKAHATESVRVPRADPTDPRGPYEFKLVDHHPEVLSARALAPHVGDDAANRVAALLGSIEAASAPRPGEPPATTFFGSHVTNRIAVAFAPGEIEVDDATGASLRP